MKSKYILTLFLSIFLMAGCEDEEFLNRKPTNVLNDDQVWNNASVALSVLVDLYDRYAEVDRTDRWWEFVNYDYAFPSATGDYARAKHTDLPYDWYRDWDYGYVREMNQFIEKCTAATGIEQAERDRMVAEARFLRAANYFEKVKRMGGVPLITEVLVYDYSGNPSYLQYPRAKEAEIYDFVISELDAVKNILPDDPNIKSRATKGAVLAMKARAALYAGSIAKYGATTPEVSLPGGEVGIPASRANEYYQTALSAAQELISGGKYGLYLDNPEDLSANFAAVFYDESNNNEAIFVRDYKLQSGKIVGWTLVNQPWSGAEDLEGGRVNPSLNIVQSFELLDNTFAQFNIGTIDNPVYYDNVTDVFANRDKRLAGTVILPGSAFKSKPVDIWAGYLLADGDIVTSNASAGTAVLPGKTVPEQVVGYDGPINTYEFLAQTGFYIRKYMDPASGTGMRGPQSGLWWIRYRYAEVLLNAAEAAFELGQNDVAVGYMNQVRRRAGFETDLTANQITFDRIVNERKVELAFEGHNVFDLRRWRIGHLVWNGQAVPPASMPGVATAASTRPYGLWPYKYYNPGDPNDGKWVFRIVLPDQVGNSARRFRIGNYYSSIDESVITRNPKIVRNPNQ